MSIYYYDALAGAGKTYQLARCADRVARGGQKVLFVQPSKLLITKTIKDEIAPLGPTYPVTPIHSDVTDNVIGTLVDHFKNAGRGGEIVFVTHAALLRLPYAENGQDWFVIVDEVLAVDVFEELVLPDTHALLTDFLDLIPTGATYARLIAREGE